MGPFTLLILVVAVLASVIAVLATFFDGITKAIEAWNWLRVHLGREFLMGLLGGAIISGLMWVILLILLGKNVVFTTVAAKRFVLIGDDQKERATLSIEGKGAAQLAMNDMAGNQRAIVAVQTDGTPYLKLVDQSNKDRVFLGFGSNNTRYISFLDDNGNARVGMGSWSDGSPYLGVWAPDGKASALLSVNDSTGVPYVGLWDHNSQERTELYASDDEVSFFLKDAKGAVREWTGVKTNGAAYFKLYGEKNTAETGFGQDSFGYPVFYLTDDGTNDKLRIALDKDGKAHLVERGDDGITTWHAP